MNKHSTRTAGVPSTLCGTDSNVEIGTPGESSCEEPTHVSSTLPERREDCDGSQWG